MSTRSNPLLIPEIVGLVVEKVERVSDLSNCARVNKTWNVAALRELYRGSLNDMQFRTPDIGSLNCLLVASRVRFAQNMGLVKHLLLSPEVPAVDEAAHPDSRLACLEKCRAIRNRQYAELLLRPKGSGLASLTIPFQTIEQDWSHISDLLLRLHVEFLAIDIYYCQVMMANAHSFHGPTNPTFSKLKALTIYRSASHYESRMLFELIECCDLEFFHLEEQRVSECLSHSEALDLMLRLSRHQKLKMFALVLSQSHPLLGSLSSALIREGIINLWPRLKALFLGVLRVIELVSLELDNGKFLADIALGCPFLQKLSVGNLKLDSESLDESLVLNLVVNLPLLEFLALGLKCQMDGAFLGNVAHHCPRLTVLNLYDSQLCLSIDLIAKLHPFQKLESMQFSRIYFENPQRLLQRDTMQSIVTEWRRVFPKLREMPCVADIYSKIMQGDNIDDLEEDDVHGEIAAILPGLDFDDYDSDWFVLRTKLWKALGYGRDMDIHDKIEYMWQTNMEIEMIGWPVLSSGVFSDPAQHSTA
ncbi:hypothetical protein TMatcc_006758 [Talaromyces marneffei ATCC 18224]|uniref:F-box domain-containing protein n=1 Tax=Talaromyces marneffei (strain ATCC 18224 / CBS 334.59 / QM 7333) TaxID=441960 RepID=B6QCW7_TALMQ|nr:conserved hypothetical protein [Talaromyces marneffei ATCC 18224]